MTTLLHTSRRPRAGFTLVELLVVMGIMALLSTVSIAGYYAAVRGMAERGALSDTASLIRAAQQRCLIDQTPTAVFFYNTRLRQANSEENAIVVGTAIAVRRAGRISSKDGDQYLCDEFADLNASYMTNANADANIASSGIRLFRFKNQTVEPTVVEDTVVRRDLGGERLLVSGFTTNLVTYAFKVKSGGSDWKVGDAYAFEFATLQLPRGFIYGSSAPSTTFEAVGKPIFFDPDNVQDTLPSITISAYRPGPNGTLTVQKVGTSTEENKK